MVTTAPRPAPATIGPEALPRALAYARRPEIQARWLRELGELIAFPTVSTAPEGREAIDAAADWLVRHLRRIGLPEARVLPGPGGGPPSVFARWGLAPGKPTLLVYGHFDVQPPGTLAGWRSHPFRATRTGDLLVARGASDDKGQLFAQLAALESWLAATGRLPLNVAVWLEGEEEAGSPHLGRLLDREGDRLRADAALVADTRLVAPGRPGLVLGLRGLLRAEIAVHSSAGPRHAGRHGGGSNPLHALAAIVTALHHPDGRIAIPGLSPGSPRSAAQ